MFGIDFTFLFAALNLFIIYYFVNKFLFKKLGGFMEKRSALISANLEKGETLKLEGEQFRRKSEEALSESYELRKEIIEDAKQKASKEYDSIILKAKEEAAEIVKQAKEESERQRAKMYRQLQQDIAALAVSAASRVIEANMDNEKNRDIVERFLQKEGAA